MNQRTSIGAKSRLTVKLLGSVAVAAMLAACGHAGDTAKLAAAPKATQQSDLAKATSYWAGKFHANPGDATNALNYVKNLKAMGKTDNALSVLQSAYKYNPNSKEIASEYGRMALSKNNPKLARKVLANAYNPMKPDWRVVSAQGTAEAKLGNYKSAQSHFRKALDLSPEQPSVLNNLALAYALDGQANEAEGLLRRATEGKAASPKVKQNLALILGMQGRFKEAETVSSSQLSRHKVADNMSYLRRMVKAMPAEEPQDQTVVADVPAAVGGGALEQPIQITPNAAQLPAAEPVEPLRGTTKVAEQQPSEWTSTVSVAEAEISTPIAE